MLANKSKVGHLVSQKRRIAEMFGIASVISWVSFSGSSFYITSATASANEMWLEDVEEKTNI